MIEAGFFAVLLLNTTGLFRFIAPILGISIGSVSLGLLLLQGLYLLVHRKESITALPKLLPWFVILVLWPAATLLYAPLIDLRGLGLCVYSFILLASAVVYTLVNDLGSMRLLFGISFGITILGEALNLIFPTLFESTAALAGARLFEGLRPGGFFLQPNSLGSGLVILFIAWLAIAKRDTILREPTLMMILMLSLLFTGSRTAVILGVVALLAHLAYQWYWHLFRGEKSKKIGYRLLVLAVLVAVGLLSARLIIQFGSGPFPAHLSQLSGRFSPLVRFRLLELKEFILSDGSITKRIAIQKEYWDWILDKPLLGYGLGASADWITRAAFERSPHSGFLSQGFDFGLLYPIAALGLVLSLLFFRTRRDLERSWGTNAVTQFVIIFGLLYLWGGNLFRAREFTAALGMFWAAVNYPEMVNQGQEESPVVEESEKDVSGSELSNHAIP